MPFVHVLFDFFDEFYVFDKSGDSFTFNQIISVNYNKNLGQFIDIENNFMICTNTNSTNGETNVLSYEKQSNSWSLVNNFNVGNLGENKNLKVNYSNNQLFVSKSLDSILNEYVKINKKFLTKKYFRFIKINPIAMD